MSLLPSLRPKYRGPAILSAKVGNNNVQLKDLLALYALPLQTIYDVTWGLGAMWQGIDASIYHVHATDIEPEKIVHPTPKGIMTIGLSDFTNLGWKDRTGDVLILDPPYMGGKQTHEALAKAYNNQNDDHEAVIRLYTGGLLEAWRVLKFGGRVFVKCQDEASGDRQRWTHCELMVIMEAMGFNIADLFVLVNESQPMLAHSFQRSARKNHSYWIVGIKPYARPSKRNYGHTASETT